jgi:hypothetical protein
MSDAPALTISARNAMSVTGMSWARVLRLARRLEVPVLEVSRRTHLVPAAPLMEAIAREATRVTPPLDPVDQMLVDIGARSR